MSIRRKHLPSRGFRRPSRIALATALMTSAMAAGGYWATSAFAADEAPTATACEHGAVCLWSQPFYAGSLHAWDLRTANPGDCIAVPADAMGKSLGNRMDRELTTFADAGCSTAQAKQIYPAGGTFSPQSPFPVAAITIGD